MELLVVGIIFMFVFLIVWIIAANKGKKRRKYGSAGDGGLSSYDSDSRNDCSSDGGGDGGGGGGD